MCGIFFYMGDQIDVKKYSDKLTHRGPDQQKCLIDMDQNHNYYHFGFNRLSIVGLTDNANQPIIKDNVYLMCNGEIFNHRELYQSMNRMYYEGDSDCQVIIDMYLKFGFKETIEKLDGEYALVMVDFRSENGPVVMAARDDVGVRPMFWGAATGPESPRDFGFASEAKALVGLCPWIKQFPAGHYLIKQCSYQQLTSFTPPPFKNGEPYEPLTWNDAKSAVRELLINEIKKRLMSDREIGVFLSGGLDSSLIAAITASLKKNHSPRLKSFSIGTSKDSPDLVAARKVAEHINTDHHEVIFSPNEGLAALDDLIYHLETWDITTIRASLPMYLLSKYIKENTHVTVMLTGEGADESFGGYLYLHNAPTPMQFQKESERLTDELMYFDVLRCDRATAAWSLEVRPPMLGREMLPTVLNMSETFKDPRFHRGIEKHLLREAFSSENWIPEEILRRPKDAFSDGVGSNWKTALTEFAESQISDEDFQSNKFLRNPPPSKEAYFYRCIFEKHFPGYGDMIPHYWMPKWTNEHLGDPSATALKIYDARHQYNA